jgi:hypothetical protein
VPYVGDCSTVLVAPAYQTVTYLRTEALTEAVLQATVPWQTAS